MTETDPYRESEHREPAEFLIKSLVSLVDEFVVSHTYDGGEKNLIGRVIVTKWDIDITEQIKSCRLAIESVGRLCNKEATLSVGQQDEIKGWVKESLDKAIPFPHTAVPFPYSRNDIFQLATFINSCR